ncbi:uncharacterized protein LOC144122908 [Amblyomma americanum]
MEPRTLGALLLLMLHLLQSRADRESNVPVQRDVRTPPDELLGTGMAASLAAILGLIQASLTSGLPESSRPQPDVGGGGGLLSLSNQVGLKGVNRLITQISNQERLRALEDMRRVYCGRMAACQHGQQMVLDMGRQQAEVAVDKNMEYLDSAMMGIRGHDCRNMYRGCMDFQ